MIQDFVRGILDQFEVSQEKTRVGVISWSDEATIDLHLNEFTLKQDVLTVTFFYSVLTIDWRIFGFLLA